MARHASAKDRSAAQKKLWSRARRALIPSRGVVRQGITRRAAARRRSTRRDGPDQAGHETQPRPAHEPGPPRPGASPPRWRRTARSSVPSHGTGAAALAAPRDRLRQGTLPARSSHRAARGRTTIPPGHHPPAQYPAARSPGCAPVVRRSVPAWPATRTVTRGVLPNRQRPARGNGGCSRHNNLLAIHLKRSGQAFSRRKACVYLGSPRACHGL